MWIKCIYNIKSLVFIGILFAVNYILRYNCLGCKLYFSKKQIITLIFNLLLHNSIKYLKKYDKRQHSTNYDASTHMYIILDVQ